MTGNPTSPHTRPYSRDELGELASHELPDRGDYSFRSRLRLPRIEGLADEEWPRLERLAGSDPRAARERLAAVDLPDLWIERFLQAAAERPATRTITTGEIELASEVHAFCGRIAGAGGRGIVVGGAVRDHLLGGDAKDVDLEVYGIGLDALESLLGGFGEVITVGKQFGVLRVKGIDIDVSVPRRDSKIGVAHTDFRVDLDPDMTFAEAARRRDLTVNAIGYDPRRAEYLDPLDGVEDLRCAVLRAADPDRFAEDPLRPVRVAQFVARFEFEPDARLIQICRAVDLGPLPGERLSGELEKLLLRARRPSIGLEFLRTTDLIRFFPELAAMIGCPQDREWHPEGDVWQHTMLVLDEAAMLRSGDAEQDLTLMFAALCHDLGKPGTTVRDEQDRIRSPNHEREGVRPTRELMRRLRQPHDRIDRVTALVDQHLAPTLFPVQGAGPRAYRRLARRLGEAGTTVRLLARLANADHFGRTTEDALARRHEDSRLFLERAEALEIEDRAPVDAVQGRHLIALGLTPGPGFGPILDRCREIQYDTGETDPEAILEALRREGGLPRC